MCAVAGLKPCRRIVVDASRVDDRVSQARISEPFQIVAKMLGRASALQTYRRPTRVVSTTGVSGEHF
jgi:hypothetical protein